MTTTETINVTPGTEGAPWNRSARILCKCNCGIETRLRRKPFGVGA